MLCNVILLLFRVVVEVARVERDGEKKGDMSLKRIGILVVLQLPKQSPNDVQWKPLGIIFQAKKRLRFFAYRPTFLIV